MSTLMHRGSWMAQSAYLLTRMLEEIAKVEAAEARVARIEKVVDAATDRACAHRATHLNRADLYDKARRENKDWMDAVNSITWHERRAGMYAQAATAIATHTSGARSEAAIPPQPTRAQQD